jgi:hypothetical protein
MLQEQLMLFLTGGAKISSFSKFGNGSLSLGAVAADYAYIAGTNQALNLGTADFTVELWVYLNATTAQSLVDYRPTSVNGVYFTLDIAAGGAPILYVSSANRIAGTAISAGVWTHIAVVRSSGVTKLYQNGTQTGSSYTDANNYLLVANRPVFGANSFGSPTGDLNGYIDELRITPGKARYLANFTPPTAALPTY